MRGFAARVASVLTAEPVSTTDASRPDRPPAWQVLAATALVYGWVGWLSYQLANPVGFATPLFPPAGIALACVLVYGWPAAVGVALGATALMPLALPPGNLPGAIVATIAPGIGIGAALQAVLGAGLVRRVLGEPLTLSEPREIALFVGLAGFTACLVNATNGTALLAIAGALPPALWPATWATWWSGDLLGVIVATPIVLSLVGRPRSEWRPRRRAVGLTLAGAIALLVVGITQISRLDNERIAHRIEREADRAVAAVRLRLQDPLRTLEVTRGIFLASDEVTQKEMHRAAQEWLYPPGPILAVGWGERVSRSPVAPSGGSAVSSGTEQPAHASALAGDSALAALVVRYVEPFDANAALLDADLFADPANRRAIARAIRDGVPVASAPFAPAATEAEDATAVTVYAAVYHGTPATPAERLASYHGVVFVTLRVDQAVREALNAVAGHMSICIVDGEPGGAPLHLAGPRHCESGQATPQQVHALDFAGQAWQLRIQSPTGALAGMPSHEAWLFSVAGILSAGMLSALLLLLTGRAQRIEQAVADRTRALSRQVRERELAEAALRESEQRFRNIFDNVSIGVVYADLDGVIRQVNSRYAAMVGFSVDELIGSRVLDHMHPQDSAQDGPLTRQLVAGAIPTLRGQRRMLRKDGETLWVQTTVTLLRDQHGMPQHLVAVVEDIGDQLRLVEAERAREAAEAANRAKSDFLSRMSHELRTPLNAMLGFAQLLELDRRQPLAESHQVQVAQIQQAGWHLLEMINDVLDLSRVDSDNLRLQDDSLSLPLLIDAAWALVAGEAASRRLVVDRQLSADALLVQGDATRVKQILTNLLSNAVKYNVDNGRIELRTRAVGRMVELTVSDTGAGMTPAQVGALFQAFNRLGRERSAIQGTGIGLLISRRLAELMGGTIEARSVAGTGSTFILSLPAAGSAPRSAPAPAVATSAEVARYRARIVHYVEDNPTNVEVMRGILAQRPQVQLVVSVTGLDGLADIRADLPDVILLDMHLPDIEGIELLRHLKAGGVTACIPVVVVSADALPAQIEAALDAGAEHYLTKPIDIAQLLAILDELLEEAVTRF